MYRKILVPLDGSELAETALPHAVELARAFNGRITLLAVVEPPSTYAQYGVYTSVNIDVQELLDSMKRYLEKVAERLRMKGLKVQAIVAEGYPAAEICDHAKDTNVDLIVMSTHGRSGVQRWVYGSVADRVLRCASVPVLLVRVLTDEQSRSGRGQSSDG